MSLHIAIFSSVFALGGVGAHPVEVKKGNRYLTANLRRTAFSRRQAPVLQGQNGAGPVIFDAGLTVRRRPLALHL